MARPGITPEQVLQTIQQLESEGAEATITAIRERLGTGSFTTIGQILQSWRQERARISRPPVPELPDQVAGLFRQLWAESWRAADAVGAAEREAAAQERAAAEAQSQEMQGEIARLEQALAALQTEMDQLATAHAAANQALQEARIEHAQAAASSALLQEEIAQLRNGHRQILEAGQKASAELATWIARATRAETRLEEIQKHAGNKRSPR
jgi:DNA repair exonuclease SbcCD ATPase subunit